GRRRSRVLLRLHRGAAPLLPRRQALQAQEALAELAMPPLLRVQELTLGFSGLIALDDVSFDVNEGELLAIIGPNGAGKTSIFNCLNGVYRPRSGLMRFLNRDLRGLRPHEIAQLGLPKRVQLGRALAMEPKLLLLDEPVAGMNLEETEDIARFVLDVKEELGITQILVDHDMGVVLDIADRVIVLDFGRKIAEGTPDEIRKNPDVARAYLGQPLAAVAG